VAVKSSSADAERLAPNVWRVLTSDEPETVREIVHAVADSGSIYIPDKPIGSLGC
jgi:hypothetical protein